MAKANNEQQVSETKVSEATFTLEAFLGTKSLTRAEKTYYTRHFGKDKKELTLAEWSNITGLA